METKEYIQAEFEGVQRGTTRVLDGLTQAETMWRPSCGCNSIGLILLHMGRFEDSFVQSRMQGKPEVWETDRWFSKLDLAQNETGAHLTVDQVNAYPVPQLKDLSDYCAAVRAKTVAYLNTLTPEGFDLKITMPRFGDRTVGQMFAMVTGHLSQHVGEMSYLRGMQRGMDK